MNERSVSCLIVHGTVKWFDPAKGFGFVVADTGGPDILLHSNVLRNFGQSSVADGSFIRISAQETERGMQAIEVIEISAPDLSEPSLQEDIELVKQSDSAPYLPARVKWFDKGKGFGFANIFGDKQDIFIHAEVLRLSGLSELMPGEAICVKIADGKRGKMATIVSPWDAAVEK